MLRLAIALLVVLTGTALMSYPFISDLLNQRAQDEVSHTQQQVVASVPPAELTEEKTAATLYNERLLDGSSHVVDPFDVNDVRPDNDEYERVLNLAGDGVMAELLIPKIEVNLPIYHYTNEESLAHGIGHVVNTSIPFGGPATHSVLAGHTGLPTARLFDRLNELVTGDWFIIRVLGEEHAYRVYSTEVVLPDEVAGLAVAAGRDLVTLVTCTPYGVNSHRLLVHAERFEPPAEWTATDGRAAQPVVPAVPGAPPQVWSAALAGAGAAAGLLLMAYLVVWAMRRIRRRPPDDAEVKG